jgi:hypothetical protein
MKTRKTAGVAIMAALASSAAHAQSMSPAGPDTKAGLNLSDAHVSIGLSRPASADAPLANRTSVEHTFGPEQVTASIGYLCGLQPPSDRTPGPASTFGPVSTFLGGKLTYAFK